MNVAELPTPALLLDIDLFDANIARMADVARRAGKALRPHAKAHKCVAIARRQIEAGAAGVCVATLAEAELMAHGGIADILLTSPVADAQKCRRAAALADRLAVVVDHATQARLYEEAARAAGVTLRVLVDLDVGDHRTGIALGQPAVTLAETVVTSSHLRFAGLQAYSVRASHLPESEGRAQYSAQAFAGAQETQALLAARGIPVPTITGASTGSYAADVELPYVTELQAGSYALMDVAYARIGGIPFGHALTVLATVVSANHPDRVTVDAGFKAFSTDRPFGPEPVGLPGARFAWAGDEFGFVFFDTAAAVQLGDRLRFLPPHCDPTINLYDRLYVCRGEEVLDEWPVMGRQRAAKGSHV